MIDTKRIIIVIPVYNNEMTIENVLSRIPTNLKYLIDEFVIVDDGSNYRTKDKIALLAQRYRNITCITHDTNKGYSQAQKTGFRTALDKGADIIALLHADGQYAPEELLVLLEPLLINEADIVQGSRILGGKALEGGMPLYKYITIRIASIIENLIYGMKLLEYHSGYMLYSRKAIETIPFEKLSNTMYFDGEMLFMGHDKGLRIKSLPISTRYYKGQKSGVKPVNYIFQVAGIMVKKLLGRYNF
jgi:glycosyltransferase involved in cell wall biosynthesis